MNPKTNAPAECPVVKTSAPEECPVLGVSVRPVKLVTPFHFAKQLAAGVLVFAGVVGVTASAMDTRWATVAFVEAKHAHVLEVVAANQAQIVVEIRYAADQVRKMALEDEVYKLQETPGGKLGDGQRAQLARALRQLSELNARWVNPPPGSKQ